MSHHRTFLTGVSCAALLIGSAAQADIVQTDDVIIDGSLCVGIDCNNGESFSFDTIRMKENNLRFHFDDTSASASFPSNDWRLTANDSSNGGGSYLGIEDATAGRIPFRVEAGARANALYVESDGDVGVGTADPVVNVHIKEGNTPTLRLEQDGSSGFQTQTYDVAANEANFFIRDVTNGSALFFRAKPGAPADSIYIAADGDIGLGTDSPAASLDIRSSDGTGKIQLLETSGTQASREMLRMENNGGSFFTLANTATSVEWGFVLEDAADNRFIIGNSVNPTESLFYETDGDMTIGGTLTENSDKNAKMAIEPVDPAEVLATLNQLEVARWTYKDDDQSARHMGPMAQDFHALFGLGATETGISTLDTSGVALAAIQALSAEVEALKAELAALK